MGMITFNAPCSFVASVALVVVSLPHHEVKLFYSRTKMRRRIKDQPTDGRTDRQTGSQAARQTVQTDKVQSGSGSNGFVRMSLTSAISFAVNLLLQFMDGSIN